MSLESGEKSDLVAIAVVGKSFGLHGWCRLYPYGETLEVIKLPATFKAVSDGPRDDFEVVLTAVKRDSKGLIGKFKGITTPEAVDSVKNCRLSIPDSALPQKGEDEFYHFELEGMKVISDADGSEIGVVERVSNYPTVDALEVKRKSGSMVTIPMTPQTTPVIDRVQKLVVVDMSVIEELL